MSTQHKTRLFTVLHVASFPVKLAAHGLHLLIPHNRKLSRFLIGVIVVLTGSLLASVEQHIVPHFLWDAFAWLVHGIGSAPIIESAIKTFALRELEELEK